MRRIFAALLCLLVLLALQVPARQTPKEAPATLVLTGGRVWTGNPKQPWATAVAIRDEKIIAVGSEAEILALAGAQTKRIALGGRFAMPGINDAHIHFGGMIRLTQVDLNGKTTIEQMQQAVAQYARENPGTAWIQGFGWQYNVFPGSLPHRAMLDAVVKDRPVFLSAYDGHTGWANSKALEIAGINRDTKYDGFGEIVHDAKGEPTGVLKERAQSLVRNRIPPPSPEQTQAALRRGIRWAVELGITSIQNASGAPEDFARYEELLRSGELTLRVNIAVSVDPDVAPERMEEIRTLAAKYRGPLLRGGAIKIVADGVIETHTAAMLKPFANKPGDTGKSLWTLEDLKRVIVLADKAGLQVYTHAIGDRAVRMTLDAYEYTRKVNGPRDARHRIEHIETVSPQDLPRFAKLSVLASMEPIHAYPVEGDAWSDAVGPERLRRAFAWRSLEKAGATLVFSSDWPAAVSIDPMLGLHTAVNRKTKEGRPPDGWIPQQRVSVETALRAYTRAGAYSSFEENIKGTLEAGKLADLIVLSADPFRIPPAELHKCRVELTVFNGRVVFERGK
jgi:predicted amidohydrolase YtcJ